MFNTFPNTTFGQNNGVIQLTGIASRKVGFFVAALFVLIGCFPIVGGVLQAIPKPVLGGATLVMFAMVAVGGLKLLASYALDRRSSLVTACALGMAIGVMMVPEALAELPTWLENILLSPVTSAGLTAVILELTLPGKKAKSSDTKPELSPKDSTLASSATDEISAIKSDNANDTTLSPKTNRNDYKNKEAVSFPQPLNVILGIKGHADGAPTLFGAKSR